MLSQKSKICQIDFSKIFSTINKNFFQIKKIMTYNEKKSLYESIMNEVEALLEEKIKGRLVKWTRDAVEDYLEEHPDIRTPGDL